MKFLDTDVCIDILRQYPPAVTWFVALQETLGLPGFVVLELLQDCKNLKEVRKVQSFVARFPVVWPSTAFLGNTTGVGANLMLSHGVGVFDLLIAFTVVEQEGTILTFNTKHYRAIPDLRLEIPYQR